jgi:integrase
MAQRAGSVVTETTGSHSVYVSQPAAVAALIDSWLDVHEGAETTLHSYRGYLDRTIKPTLGDLPISQLRTQTLEKLYAQLRKCNGKPVVDHRTSQAHECRVMKHRRKPGRPSAKAVAEHDCATAGCLVLECKPHVCKPRMSCLVGEPAPADADVPRCSQP